MNKMCAELTPWKNIYYPPEELEKNWKVESDLEKKYNRIIKQNYANSPSSSKQQKYLVCDLKHLT